MTESSQDMVRAKQCAMDEANEQVQETLNEYQNDLKLLTETLGNASEKNTELSSKIDELNMCIELYKKKQADIDKEMEDKNDLVHKKDIELKTAKFVNDQTASNVHVLSSQLKLMELKVTAEEHEKSLVNTEFIRLKQLEGAVSDPKDKVAQLTKELKKERKKVSRVTHKLKKTRRSLKNFVQLYEMELKLEPSTSSGLESSSSLEVPHSDTSSSLGSLKSSSSTSTTLDKILELRNEEKELTLQLETLVKDSLATMSDEEKDSLATLSGEILEPPLNLVLKDSLATISDEYLEPPSDDNFKKDSFVSTQEENDTTAPAKASSDELLVAKSTSEEKSVELTVQVSNDKGEIIVTKSTSTEKGDGGAACEEDTEIVIVTQSTSTEKTDDEDECHMADLVWQSPRSNIEHVEQWHSISSW